MNLELFHRENCPYSAKVRNFIAAEGLRPAVAYRDVEEDAMSERILSERTHDTQVPCLMIDGAPLLESDEIISFLREHRGELGRN